MGFTLAVTMRTFRLYVVALAAFVALAPSARAHPVPKSNHDRTLVVRLEREAQAGRMVATVAYRLELDELTVIEDMRPFEGDGAFSKFGRNRLDEFYGEFTRVYAPILARKLHATLDGKRLTFQSVRREHRLRDDQGQLLGHLRCDFEFRATAYVAGAAAHEFAFREGNYLEQNGAIDVSLAVGPGIKVARRTIPDTELKKRAAIELRPGDDDRLRQVDATFELKAPPVAASPVAPPVAPPAPAPPARQADDEGLLQLFLHSDHALWVLLLVFAGIGAVHALTPGHGKTLVAAYLVGAHGTVWHALALGLVTTFTHTAIVIAVALGLYWLYPTGAPADARQNVQFGLQLIMGLLVLCAGVWLLLRRLAGKADHFHIGSGHHHHHGPHHHHHHAHAGHDHDAAGNAIPRTQAVGWGALVALGMSGGIVPCWDAIAILGFTVGTDLIWLALPLVVAFSLGLAAVLVLIGVLVVKARGFASSHWGEGWFVRALPVASALLVTAMGFWLCYEAVHARPDERHVARPAAGSHP
ncbi:MAG: hypothetical protein IT429_07190 [Gemmataceae bacterium]|nr:hypothetical protein [Gemmataceae bacterium]